MARFRRRRVVFLLSASSRNEKYSVKHARACTNAGWWSEVSSKGEERQGITIIQREGTVTEFIKSKDSNRPVVPARYINSSIKLIYIYL